jgi:hypothetical protein
MRAFPFVPVRFSRWRISDLAALFVRFRNFQSDQFFAAAGVAVHRIDNNVREEPLLRNVL